MTDGAALMTNLRRALLACLALALLASTACSASASTDPQTIARDPDAVALEAMADDARSLAQETESTAVLRQVDIGVSSGRHFFRFTDAASTLVVVVVAPGMDSPPESWEVHAPSVSPLVGHVAADLSMGSLRTGPAAVQRAASSHWGSCGRVDLTLTGEGDDLVWYIFCELPEGVVSGTVDGRTGEFIASDAPPASRPPTATPEP